MTDEAKRMGSKRMNPIRSAFEALVVQCVVECCHEEELGPVC